MYKNGLTTEEVLSLREKYGKNELEEEKKENLFIKIISILKEPMFVLLLISSIIYFLLGEPKDGIVMLFFVLCMSAIEIVQEWKTDKTLQALKRLSSPKVTVIRNREKVEIASNELVPGDIVLIHEGLKIPADGHIVKCSGLRIDESSLTGESIAVWKSTEDTSNEYWKNNYCYQGTLVLQGSGIMQVDKIGAETEYGRIGKNIQTSKVKKTLLQEQTDTLIKVCAIIAFILFLLVSLFTFINSPSLAFKERIIASILSGVTLAMAMIPEEFPVVLTVFLSSAAWRLAKKNSLVKKIPSVETLGAISVLCVDKTGTITKNEMEIEEVYTEKESKELATIMCLGCIEETYDPMEKAMFKYARTLEVYKKDLFKREKIKEFPFSDETKIMANVWKDKKNIVLAAKGSPESILKLCTLSKKEKAHIKKQMEKMQANGLRVIAIAKKEYSKKDKIEENLQTISLEFIGLVGLLDPPRETIKEDIAVCKKAGIKVIMITGDNGLTAASIAKKVGISAEPHILTGIEIDKCSEKELQEKVKDIQIFARVIPEHKMRIVSALQANGEIVAMTGDGVNDAPALKKADIGISMGKRGSEVAREASDLILMDDNFSTIVHTIKDGRRIYDNIKKAIKYIIIIHLPIAFSALGSSLLKINPDSFMLLPIHIVLLELMIDPTCSIVLERQKEEEHCMERKPRSKKESIVNKKNILSSIIQGLLLFIASFGVYYYYLNKNILVGRTMSLLILILGNLFLVLVNASGEESVLKTILYNLKDKVLVTIHLFMLFAIFMIIYSPMNSFFRVTKLSLVQVVISLLLSFISVFWYELRKINFKK